MGRFDVQDLERSHAVACRAAHEGGALIQALRAAGPVGEALKDGFELVTEADLASDRLIRSIIAEAFPAHQVVSEETWDGWRDGLFDGPVWIVDPLDGTVNFAHGHPFWSVSVAFAVDGVVLAGAVEAPALGQRFEAARGGGSRLDGVGLAVARPTSLAEALIGTGFPHRRNDLDEPLERVRRLLSACRDLRRMASPALDICWVGAGLLDAHTESLAPWDVAAAALIATEAGARRGTLLPQPFPWPDDLAGAGFVVAAPTIYDELFALLG